jgi:outer membrane lipoprotein-sorting protein
MTGHSTTIRLVTVAVVTMFAGTPSETSQDLLGRIRTTYESLKSYADTGTVTVEIQAPGSTLVVERHTFTTRFRGPRNFYFDFKKDPAAGDERMVIWCGGGDFESWWSVTGVHDVHSGGRGVMAFGTAVFPTQGAALQIPPLLFPKAEMHGSLVDAKDIRAAGTETINGRPTRKMTGVAQAHFGAARPITIWVDAETMLVRKIVEDRPADAPAGSVDRITTTFEPRLNPDLDDSAFRFAVPSGK